MENFLREHVVLVVSGVWLLGVILGGLSIFCLELYLHRRRASVDHREVSTTSTPFDVPLNIGLPSLLDELIAAVEARGAEHGLRWERQKGGEEYLVAGSTYFKLTNIKFFYSKGNNEITALRIEVSQQDNRGAPVRCGLLKSPDHRDMVKLALTLKAFEWK